MEWLADSKPIPPYDQDRAESSLSLQAATQFLEELPYPAVWIDPERRIRWRNKAATEAYGSTDDPCYKAIHGFETPCPEHGDRCPLLDSTTGTSPTLRHIHRTEHGPKFYLVAPLPIQAHGVITVHLPIEDTLLRDSLTHLYTRTAFEQLVEMQLQLLRRLKQGYAVVIADVDRLKSINDEHGHAAGDGAIATVARTLAGSVRAADCIGRWGGDEFCVLLPSASRKDAEKLVRRVQRTLSGVQVPEFPLVVLKVSFGIASSHERYELGPAIDRADRALYRAKQRRLH